MKKVLFICTGNAGRSQMAEALLRKSADRNVSVLSAGVDPWNHLHPIAVKVLAEDGIITDNQYPKHVQSMTGENFDLVVTIGEPARQKTPVSLTNGRWIHWDISDPADMDGTDQSYETFKRTKLKIEKNINELLATPFFNNKLKFENKTMGIATGFLTHKVRFEPSIHMPMFKDAGFNALELTVYYDVGHFDGNDKKAVSELGGMCRELELPVWSIHTRDTGDLSSPDAYERMRQIDEFMYCTELAEKLGAVFLTSHALIIGSKRPLKGSKEQLIESLYMLLERIEKSPLRVAFENHSINSPGVRGPEILDIIKLFPRSAFGFVLDTGHSNITGETDIILQNVEDRLFTLHLNDNDGKGSDSHLAPGQGTVQWEKLFGALNNMDYRGVYMYEVASKTQELKKELDVIAEKHRELKKNYIDFHMVSPQ